MSDQYAVSVNDDFVQTDLNEVGTWDGTSAPVAAGAYQVEVEKAERKPSSKGNPMLAVELTIVAAANGSPTDEAGRTLRAWYVETGGARKRLKNFLVAADRFDEKRGGYSVGALKGARLIVGVTHEPGKYIDQNTMEEKEVTNARVGQERRISA